MDRNRSFLETKFKGGSYIFQRFKKKSRDRKYHAACKDELCVSTLKLTDRTSQLTCLKRF